MNHNISQTNLLFVDRPLTTTAVPAHRASTLRLLSAHEGDFAETALRFVMLACLIVSLAFVGLRGAAIDNALNDGASLQMPTFSKAVLHLPALPTVECASSVR